MTVAVLLHALSDPIGRAKIFDIQILSRLGGLVAGIGLMAVYGAIIGALVMTIGVAVRRWRDVK
jgi:hypothetical protein